MACHGRAGIGLLILAVVAGGAAPAAAQLPGESVFERRGNLREEYRAHAFTEVKLVLADWAAWIAARDRKKIDKQLMETVLFAPIGSRAEGRATVVDSLGHWLPRVSGYHFTPADFDASGSLAYVFGPVRYDQRLADGATTVVNAELVLVLFQWGRTWKIRSYIERPAEGGP